MTIDPTTAVTTVGGATPSPAVSDPSASTGAATADSAAAQPNAPGQAAKTDIFDYAADLKDRPPALDTLQPEGKAKYLSNPSVLGEQVLERMEAFHQRWQAKGSLLDGSTTGASAGATGGMDGVLPGPASQSVPSTINGTSTGGNNSVQTLTLVFDYAIETNMISTGTAQFSKAVNTLMRGQ